MTLNFRQLNLLGFLGIQFALCFAMYLQYFKGYEPCPFCIFQRVAMIAVGFVFLAAFIHGPKAWGQWVYAFGVSMFSLVGAGVAARHVWLQSLPPDQVPACGPTLDYLMDMMPMGEVVQTVLRGDGNCAKIDAQWLGISLPGWVLVSFFGFVVYAVLTPILPKFLRKTA